ncbi:MAG: BMP family ABC transporter substrate-binding protein [Kiritimatiellae bacterium]|nr:BMP family ABC transporter substrate-binding protein [Kiritimatiellia bacterium]
MRRFPPFRILAALALLVALSAAAASAAKPAERLRVAMIFDCGSSDDGGYNQTCREGVESLLTRFPVYANFVETDGDGEGDFVRTIAEMAERGYDLIVGVGVLIAPSIEEAAARYPKTKFATVDGGSSWPAENVCSLTFKVEEAAFPAGYLAAAWAALRDPADPAVAWIGGMEVASVTAYTEAFAAGVRHYNRAKKAKVRVFGKYIDSFDDAAKAEAAAGEYLADGVDVVFAAAGAAGNAAVHAAAEAGKWAIGVDTDQTRTLYRDRGAILTSCLKRMDRAVMQLVVAAVEGEFWGGSTYEGRLLNHGVGLAPYYAFGEEIPEETKAEVRAIEAALARGELPLAAPSAVRPRPEQP